MGKDYYNTLGVNKSASQDEIKKAFRKKAHEYHPDKTGGDEAKFKEVNEAYQVLGNSQKKSQYDQFGSTFDQAQAGGGFANGFSGFTNGFSSGGVKVDFDDLGEMFGGIGDIFGFSGGSKNKRRQSGSDIQVALTIEFSEAVFGVEKEISLQKHIVCDHCDGNLAEPGTKIETCKTCNGTGRVTKIQRTILGNMQMQAVCDACSGEGKTYAQKCKKCHGSGIIMDNSKIKIKIPAGIDNNEVIRVSGHGEAGERGAQAGDLYIKINVRKSDKFKRDGYDIRSSIFISFAQAAMGDKINVETIDGDVKLKIPAGTQSSTIFKLRGKGISRLRSSGRGDHFVEVKVKIPDSLNRKQKQLLKELNL
ncbi:molecular chaperone DnaJ [Candidatus Parcubacteria bacterium]|nr:molecular chaperone DnaJ [Candidatus Parcubacteria bacterium]